MLLSLVCCDSAGRDCHLLSVPENSRPIFTAVRLFPHGSHASPGPHLAFIPQTTLQCLIPLGLKHHWMPGCSPAGQGLGEDSRGKPAAGHAPGFTHSRAFNLTC